MSRKKVLVIMGVSLCILALVSFSLVVMYVLEVTEPTHLDLVNQIWQASFKGDTKTMERLVEQHPELINSRRDGYSLLHAAARGADLGTTKFLLQHGVDPNIKDMPSIPNDTSPGWTPLMHCVLGCSPYLPPKDKLRYLEEAKLLIRNGAEVNPKDKGSPCLLMIGTASDVTMEKLLVENGAEVPDKLTLYDGTTGTLSEQATALTNQPVAAYFAQLAKAKGLAPP